MCYCVTVNLANAEANEGLSGPPNVKKKQSLVVGA